MQGYSAVMRNGYPYYVAYYYDIYGKRRQVTGKTVEILEEKLYQKKMEVTHGVCLSSMAFEDYLEYYLKEVHFNKVKKVTQARYDSTFRTHIKGSEIGKIVVKKLKLEQLQHFINDLYKQKSKSVCEQVRKIISPCLKYAYGKGDIMRDFGGQLVIPRDCDALGGGIGDDVHPLTMEEQFAFVEAIKGHDKEALFRTAIDGGYRKGELLALTWDDVDLEKRTIHITKTYGYGEDPEIGKCCGHTTPPKTQNARRKNKIPKVLLDILLAHKKKQQVELREVGITQGDDTLVFCTPIGTHLDPSNVNKELKKVFAELGFDSKKHFHDLRHTYATRQFELGTEILVVSRMLGHSDVNVTLKTYTHVLEDLRDATADQTDLLYAKAKKEKTIFASSPVAADEKSDEKMVLKILRSDENPLPA